MYVDTESVLITADLKLPQLLQIRTGFVVRWDLILSSFPVADAVKYKAKDKISPSYAVGQGDFIKRNLMSPA